MCDISTNVKKVIVENWRQEYNPSEKDRPHSSLGYLTPAEFARQYYENNQAEEATQRGEITGTLSLRVVQKMGAPHYSFRVCLFPLNQQGGY